MQEHARLGPLWRAGCWAFGQPIVCVATLATSAFLLTGCVTNGDFGRVRPSLTDDNMHAWDAVDLAPGQIPSQFELTDYERTLRDLAYPLIEPPYDRQRWDSFLAERGLIRDPRPTRFAVDRTAYAKNLLETPFRSATARYNKLSDDIRNDIVRVEPFMTVARTVADLDMKRHKSMQYVAQLGRGEEVNAFRRMRENRLLVEWVEQSLVDRAAEYRFALERLVIAYPSRSAVDAEQALNHLCALVAPGKLVAATYGGVNGVPMVRK